MKTREAVLTELETQAVHLKIAAQPQNQAVPRHRSHYEPRHAEKGPAAVEPRVHPASGAEQEQRTRDHQALIPYWNSLTPWA
jgi:hypothetical protein